MSQSATIVERHVLRGISRIGVLLLVVCLSVICCAMPSVASAQSCGHYVQTKYERQMIELRHPLKFQQAQLLGGEPSSSKYLFLGSIGGSIGSETEAKQQAPTESKKECDGPGCRQNSAPAYPACSCPAPKDKDQSQAILLTHSNHGSDKPSFYKNDETLLLPSFSDGLFRPPQ